MKKMIQHFVLCHKCKNIFEFKIFFKGEKCFSCHTFIWNARFFYSIVYSNATCFLRSWWIWQYSHFRTQTNSTSLRIKEFHFNTYTKYFCDKDVSSTVLKLNPIFTLLFYYLPFVFIKLMMIQIDLGFKVWNSKALCAFVFKFCTFFLVYFILLLLLRMYHYKWSQQSYLLYSGFSFRFNFNSTFVMRLAS